MFLKGQVPDINKRVTSFHNAARVAREAAHRARLDSRAVSPARTAAAGARACTHAWHVRSGVLVEPADRNPTPGRRL